MRFALVSAVAVLPALVAARPPVSERVGTSIPIKKRSGLANADNSVNIDALRAHVASVQAKVQRGFANYEKNTGTPHPAALKGVEKRQSGVVPLADANDELWYGDIFVGIPSNIFSVDFDTGSSDLFLPGPQCFVNCFGHSIYDPSTSVTAQDLGVQFVLTYGDGSSVIGEEYIDTVSVAGMTAVGQTLGVASEYSNGFAWPRFPPDGLMGMGFPLLSVFNALPVFQTLVDEGQTFPSSFSFKLSSFGSELFIGGANPSLYIGTFSYVPVVLPAYWEVIMDGIVADGFTILTGIDSIIDTGTTLIIGLPNDVAFLYAVLGGTDESATIGPGFYSFPCNLFPNISFVFGGRSFFISNEFLNLGEVFPGSGRCVSGIIGEEIASFWIIGDVFLRNVYTIFDADNLQVGFAELA